jgi:1-acyl-sn-glycerol-3-phosphate acyltransferase
MVLATFLQNLTDPPPATADRRYDGRSLTDRDPQAIREVFIPMWEWFHRYYFRATSDGWEHVPADGRVLVVGSHNGGLASPDMFMLLYEWFTRYGTERLAYGLAHAHVWKHFPPGLSRMAAQTGALLAEPKMAIAALQQEAMVLVYPGGGEDVFRPYRDRYRINLAGRKGFIKIAIREGAPILPTVSIGSHESLYVLAQVYPQLRALHERGLFPWAFDIDPIVFPIYLGLPWGISFGPLPNIPLPTQVHNRICPPITFDRSGKEAARDREYVDCCYRQVESAMQSALDRLVADKQLEHSR